MLCQDHPALPPRHPDVYGLPHAERSGAQDQLSQWLRPAWQCDWEGLGLGRRSCATGHGILMGLGAYGLEEYLLILVVSNGFLIAKNVKNPTWDGHRRRIPNGPAEKSLAE